MIVVAGSGDLAAEWATRYAAAGHDVLVDDVDVVGGVRERWAAADRLGLFPGAAIDRVRIAVDAREMETATLVHIVSGAAPTLHDDVLVVDSTTVRGCTPVHLVPLVEVSGPHASRLTGLYLAMGMAPCTDETPPHERWQLGEGLVALTDGDADALIAVMRALRPSGKGAGAAIAHHEAARFAADANSPWKPGEVPDAPLRLYRTPVEPEWVDYNGHMTESAYLTAAGWASDKLFRYIGDDEDYRAAGNSFYTVETHITYIREVAVHEPIEFATQVLGVDAKRLHLVHSMFHGNDGGLLCTAEQMLVHVDMNAGRSSPILPHVADALQAIATAHAALPVPPQVGAVMRLPAPRP